MTTGAQDGQRPRKLARSRGRRSRRRSHRGKWFSVTALAVLGTVMIVHPGATSSPNLAARFGRTVAAAGPTDTSANFLKPAVPTTTFAMPLRPAPELSRQAKPAGPNVTRSTGKLVVVPGSARATGSVGKLTYRVEIEQGLSFDQRAVAIAVHRTLIDPRGWQAVKPVHFERTDRADADLRIIVATPLLTDRLCRPLDTGGEVSCRVGDRVVLNAKRWMYAVPAYAGRVDLYRSYLVNHEVGHALGHGHSTCAKASSPAPVMMQQTKGLGGCLPNAWPTVKAT